MRKIVTFGLAALAAVPVLAVSAALPETAAIEKTAAYIRTTQQDDGGFGGFGDGQTYDAILALRSAGIDVNTVVKNGKTPANFLQAKAADADTPAEASKAALAALASGLSPANVNGKNLIAEINEPYNATTGEFAPDSFSQSLAILGLACTENDVPPSALTALRAMQMDSGAWGYDTTSDPDITSLAIQALLATGVEASDADVAAAIAYLAGAQGSDGGWGFDPDASNANSTAFAIQALLAAGLDPEGAAYEKAGTNPVEFLLSQQEDDGSFAGFDPAFAANQSLPALAGRSYCDMATTELQQPATPTPSASATTTASPSVTTTASPSATSTTGPATATATVATSTATSTATMTSQPTSTRTATLTPTRTSTRASGTATRTPTRTRTPVAPRTGDGPNIGGTDSGSTAPYLAVAFVALAAGGAGLAIASRRK